MEATLQIDDPKGIEKVMDELEAQGFLNGIERPNVVAILVQLVRTPKAKE